MPQLKPVLIQTMVLVALLGWSSRTVALPVVAPSQPTQPLALQRLDPQAQALLGLDTRILSDRQALLRAVDRSLSYLGTAAAEAAYTRYPVPGFTRERVRRSLQRFRVLVQTLPSPAALQAAVQREFNFYRSVGADGAGTVHFTGYFEPVYRASTTPTAEFCYPLYRLPPDLSRWHPQPTRLELEGRDGRLGDKSRLHGLELVWLRDRLEAYLVQVQGSARLQLTNGSTLTVGYAGRTDYPYVSLGRELVQDGKIRQEDLSLPVVIHYFRQHPAELEHYILRNNRFVFFRETGGAPALGSLGVPVTAERSIATDKALMPPGALALIQTQLPGSTAAGQTPLLPVSRYVLDQDTGGAILGAGRVDLFMGTGIAAGDRAGLINSTGQLYYLLLKQ